MRHGPVQRSDERGVLSSPGESSASWRRLVFLLIGIGLSAGLLYLALRGLEWGSLGDVAREGRPGFLLLTMLLISIGLLLRAVRWSNLVAAQGVSLRMAFAANSIGYLGNLLLPARAGEFARSVILGQRSGLGASHVLAASVTERVLDALTLVIVVLLVVGTISSLDMQWVIIPVAVTAVAALAALAAVSRMSGKCHRC